MPIGRRPVGWRRPLSGSSGAEAFPDPWRLLTMARRGFRARTVVAATRQMLDDGAITVTGDGDPDRLSHDYLLGLSGIGPYAAAHCRVLLHDFSRIPVDSSVVAYLRTQYGCDAAEFAGGRSEWGAYIALGYRMVRLREKLAQAAQPSSK